MFIDWETVGIIVIINIVYVSLFTLRLILVIKGRKSQAALLSMIEVFIYLVGLNLVLQNVSDPVNMAAYCIGYGLGVYLGGRIEERLALGYSLVQVIVDHEGAGLPGALRADGYGVTSWTADGRDGPRLVMQVLVKRKNEQRLMDSLAALSPKAFVVTHELRHIRGGFWTRMAR